MNTVDDFLNYETLLSLELEQLTLPESTEGGSPLSVCPSVGTTHLYVIQNNLILVCCFEKKQ